ncbi:MAG: hypothetical protein L6Q76_34565 [Polyangiaceae bacterium]|nr:hypothetical protein [Polyangiaceae bacterium]
MNAAAQPEDIDALEKRYKRAKKDAQTRGCDAIVQRLETDAAATKAVISRPLSEVQRLATSDKQGYATYYQLVHAQQRLPDGDEWDKLRRQADEALFPDFKDKIRFAALSMDGIGVRNYGEMSVVLRDAMIRHRASVFEGNTAAFVKNRKVKDLARAVRGNRATWADRAKLCVAKLAAGLTPATKPDELPGLLLKQGATSADDDYVEVHVWGPMTARTFERVIAVQSAKRRSRAILRELRRQLQKLGVDFEER